MAEETKEKSLQERMLEAIQANDVNAQELLAAELVKARSSRIKAESEVQAKEAEALAKQRESLAVRIHEAVKALGLDKEIAELKARGFNYYIKTSYTVPGQPDVHQQPSCGLILAQAPKVKGASGNGGAGKSKDEFGMSLGEIFDKFATDADKARLTEATTNSSQWQVKVAVKKRAIAEGLLAPVK